MSTFRTIQWEFFIAILFLSVMLFRGEAAADEQIFDLLTADVYDDQYRSQRMKHPDTGKTLGVEWVIAEKLYGHSLQSALDHEILRREKEMYSLLLPLGIYYRQDAAVNLVQGMLDMWSDKKSITVKGEQGERLRALRQRFVCQTLAKAERTTLRDYRAQEITDAIDLIKKLHQKLASSWENDKRRFMELFLENFTPNVMLGYNIQELLPPRYKGHQINPVFKSYFFDRLLYEGGKKFVEGFPARYDRYVSFGPFQMTNKPMKIIHGYNRYLPSQHHIPRYVQEFEHLRHHANAAAIFAYHNWAVFADVLKNHQVLRAFNTQFPKLPKRTRQIVVAGITACMHHLPAPTRRLTAEYIKSHGTPETLHYALKETAFQAKKQLRKYYDSAAEAYLLVKVFDKLDDQYAKKSKSSASDQPQQTLAGIVTTEKSHLRIRKGPETSYPVLTHVRPGTELEVNACEEGWYKVKTENGTTGYASGKYVRLKGGKE